MKPPLRCPFWPNCEAELSPVGQLAVIGSDEIEYVYPIHDVEGPGSWFGRCPASSFLITYLPNGQYRLTNAAANWLAAQGQLYARWLVQRTAKQNAERPPAASSVEQVIAWMAGDDRIPMPSADRPERPREESFPGRPADAPEPGAGEEPAAPVPTGVGGDHFTGRGMSDSSHSTTRGLAELAVNQMGVTQDLLSRMTNALDEVETLAVAAEQQVRSVQGLVVACVGTGQRAPESGERMAEQTALAVDTIAGNDNILGAVRVAKARVDAAFSQIHSAAENGRAYIGQLS